MGRRCLDVECIRLLAAIMGPDQHRVGAHIGVARFIFIFMRSILFLLLAGSPALLLAADYYVSPTGNSAGNGSLLNPWDLQTALSTSVIQPGDRVWLRGGTYVAPQPTGYALQTRGTWDKPIIYRNYNRERAIIDAGVTNCGLGAYPGGGYAWFWGLEMTSSAPSRFAALTDPSPAAPGFCMYVPGIKVINSIVHDTAQGFSAYDAAGDSEVTGNITYYNGFIKPDRQHGHGLYLQNHYGVKWVFDNVVFQNADEGIQVYGSGTASVDHFRLTGNAAFLNGGWPGYNPQYQMMINGGGSRFDNQANANFTYLPPEQGLGTSADFGDYTHGQGNTVITSNVFVGGSPAAVAGNEPGLVFTGNTVYATAGLVPMFLSLWQGDLQSAYVIDRNVYYATQTNPFAWQTDNHCCDAYSNLTGALSYLNWGRWQALGFDRNGQFSQSPPTGSWVYVRPNRYETKRANVTIYNWELANSVNVDLSNILAVGDSFQIQDVQNLSGPALVSSIYAGAPISIPMTSTAMDPKIGWAQPLHSDQRFGAFLVTSPNSTASIPADAYLHSPDVIGPLPILTLQPQSAALNAGQSATFSVASSSSTPLSYQWQSRANVGATLANIPGATNSSYTTAATQFSDTGTQFQCVVTNSAGSVLSSIASVTVQPPSAPVITQQPQSIIVFVGQTATFTVGATGVGVTYQWQFAAQGSSIFANIPGASASSYTIPATQASDTNSQFQCVVTSGGASTTSNRATLTVQLPGSALSFVTSTAPGTLRNNYSGWVGMAIRIGGSPVAVSALGRIVVSGNTGVHTVKLVNGTTGADVAGATGTVATTGGTPGSFAYSTLANPVTLNANSIYYLVTLESSGGDQWYGNDSTVQTTTVAVVTSAVYSAAGAYVIAGASGQTYGPVDFLYATSGASGPPAIVQQPQSATVLTGGSATFGVNASSSTSPSYQWQSKTSGAASFVNIPGATSSNYTTPAVQISDTGTQFLCLIGNNAGSISSSPATLTVQSSGNSAVQSYALNGYVRYLDGQWEGIRYASDGNVYFASSSQSAHHGAAFFRFNPSSQQLTLLAEDITAVVGEDPLTNPQGKIHSNMQEMHGWLFFTTHFGADDRPNGITGWSGGHLVGYRFTDTGSNGYFNTPVGGFHDYGVIYADSPGYTSYSGIAVDPAQNYIYVFATGEMPSQASYVYRYRAATDTAATRTFLGQVYGSFGASLYWFTDPSGDVWFAVYNDNGALHRIHHDTQVIDRYDNVLPAFFREDANTIDASSDRAIDWMAPIGGSKAVFTYNGGGMLYQFDSSQATANGVPASAFTALKWIGPSYIGAAVGASRVFWYQRAGGATGHQGCDGADTVLPPSCQDYHLMSVSLDPGYDVSDHGLIVDQSGHTVWRVPSMMTDGTNNNVFMVGDWWTYDTSGNPIPGDHGINNTLRYHYSAGAETYIDEPRGEFFAVFHPTLNPLGSVSVSPSFVTLGAGQSQQFTATVQNSPNQPVLWSLNPMVGSISNSGLYQAPANISSSQAITVTAANTANLIVSGSATVTLQPPPSGGPPATAQFIKTDVTTQGNWKSSYGVDGYNVLGDAASYPSYASVSSTGPSFWTWSQSTTDPRALQKSTAADRVAATWYTASSYTLDVNLSDGQAHQVALYALDWDARSRAETVAVFDAQSGTLLNSQTLSNFTNGAYLVWTVTGHVTVQVTCTGPVNAVLSGIFFGTGAAALPVITQQPQNAAVTSGQTAAFSVSVQGSGLSYQWQSMAPGSLTFSNITGATASIYTTSPTQLTDSGTQFRCLVSNANGPVTTSAATLTVLSAAAGTAFVTSTPAGSLRNNFTGWVGMKITIGSAGLNVSAIGRPCIAGNSGTHIVKFVNAGNGTDLPGGSASVGMSGCTPGQFRYSILGAPVTLQAGASYYVVSQESQGGDQWYDHGTLTSTSVATVNSSVYLNGSTWTPIDGANTSYVPPNFLYGAPAGTIPVTVQTNPTGQSFSVDGTSYNSTQVLSWIPGSTHTIATNATQSGASGTQYVWNTWSDAGALSHTVTPSSATIYTANFTTQYLLTTNVAPGGSGSITSNPVSASGYYDNGTSVQLTAAANGSNTFTGWSGDLSDSTNPQSVTMSAPRTVTASFQPPGGSATSFLTGFALNSPPQRNDFGSFVGMKLTVGATPITVTALGRIFLTGNTGTHVVKFVRASDGVDVPGGSVSIPMTGGTAGQFQYVLLASPVTLLANTAYYLVSQEALGGDKWYDHGTLTSTSVATVNSSVYLNGSTWTPIDGTNTSYVLPNFLYSVPPPDPNPPFVTSYNLNNRPLRSDFTGWVGLKLTVGPAGMPVNSLGRIFVSGNTGNHLVKLVRASDGTDVPGASASVAVAGGASGQFQWALLASPITLQANTVYYLVTQELFGGDQWYDYGTVTTAPSAAVNSAVYSSNGTTWVTLGSANTSYVPPNLK